MKDQIANDLRQRGIPFITLTHERGADARAIAKLRDTPLAWGGKTMVLKTSKGLVAAALSSADQADNRKMRRALASSRLRFATFEELVDATGLTPGCVPPLGPPFLPMPLYMDKRLTAQPQIAFTPGCHTTSFQMNMTDYLRWAQPMVVDLVTPFGA